MSTYHVYSSLINNTHKMMRKMLPKKQRDSKIAALQTLVEHNPEILQTLDFTIFCEEWSWMQEGRQALFPKDAAVLDRLMGADFETRELSALEMPFSSFVLAMPKGYEVEGIEMPSCLVTWGIFGQYGAERMDPLTSKMGLDGLQHEYPEAIKDEYAVQIVYRDATRKPDLVYARCSLSTSQFHSLLKCNNLDDFRDQAGSYSDSNLRQIIENDPRDLVIQYHMLKLIIAIAIFNQATEGVHLRPGMPGNNVKMLGRLPDEKSVAATLSMPEIPKESSSPDAHYRRWHFRQLSHERYYQGEHAGKPRGSRWTFVRDAYIGASSESAHTIEEDE